MLRADPYPRFERLRACLTGPLSPRAADALDMECAFGLSTFGLLGEDPSLFDDLGAWGSDLGTRLYLVFRFERDIVGHRATFAEFGELAVGSFDDLLEARETEAIEERVRTRGMLAMMGAPQITNVLWHLRRGDAELEQAARAIDAFEADRTAALAQGSWVDDDPRWGDDPPAFRLRDEP